MLNMQKSLFFKIYGITQISHSWPSGHYYYLVVVRLSTILHSLNQYLNNLE